MRKLYTKSFAILLFVVFISIAGASMVYAQENPNKIDFTPVTDIPLLENWTPGQTINAEAGASNVFNQLFSLSIRIGAMLAVFMFIWGGLNMIMARDNASNITRGKEKMKNAILGLLMLLSTFVVLNTINPNLVNISLFGDSTVRLNPTQQSIIAKDLLESVQERWSQNTNVPVCDLDTGMCYKTPEDCSINSPRGYCALATDNLSSIKNDVSEIVEAQIYYGGKENTGYFSCNTINGNLINNVGWSKTAFLVEGVGDVVNRPVCSLICAAMFGDRVNATLNNEGGCVYPKSLSYGNYSQPKESDLDLLKNTLAEYPEANVCLTDDKQTCFGNDLDSCLNEVGNNIYKCTILLNDTPYTPQPEDGNRWFGYDKDGTKLFFISQVACESTLRSQGISTPVCQEE